MEPTRRDEEHFARREHRRQQLHPLPHVHARRCVGRRGSPREARRVRVRPVDLALASGGVSHRVHVAGGVVLRRRHVPALIPEDLHVEVVALVVVDRRAHAFHPEPHDCSRLPPDAPLAHNARASAGEGHLVVDHKPGVRGDVGKQRLERRVWPDVLVVVAVARPAAAFGPPRAAAAPLLGPLRRLPVDPWLAPLVHTS